MNVQQLRKALTYAMMVCAFGTLHLSKELSPIVVVLFYAGALVSWFWESPRVDLARWAQPWTFATVGVFLFTLFDLFVLDEFFLVSALNFILFLATAKLFQRAEDKDYHQAMALSLLLLAAGAALNENLSYGVLFAIYVVTATLGMTTQHLSLEIATHPGLRRPRMERAIVLVTLALGFSVFAGSAAFFFLFPRVGIGAFVQQSRRGVTSSGFGDSVELGGHGTIATDATIVLRVSFPDGLHRPIEEIHWRGLSLDLYDGRRWADTDEETVRTTRFEDGQGYALVRASQFATWNRLIEGTIRVEINQEPIAGTDVLFAPGRPIAMQLPGALTELPDSMFGRRISADITGEITFQARNSMGVRYIMFGLPIEGDPSMRGASWAGSPDLGTRLQRSLEFGEETVALPEPELGAEPVVTPTESADDERGPIAPLRYNERTPWRTLREQIAAADAGALRGHERRLLDRYLQVPDDVVTPRMAALLDDVRAEHPDAWDFTQALIRWMDDELTYTTDLPAPSSPDANLVDEFLFEWKRGHCEYFATSLAVLLRAHGIPTRLVNGFLGGDYNEMGDFYAVRQANAHSWVEVFFPGQGWVQVDPTPGGSVAFAPTGRFPRLDMFIDNLRLAWFRWVVEYDLEKQFSTARDTINRLRGADESQSFNLPFADWMRRQGWALIRNFRALSLFVLAGLFASFLFRRRALNRQPWAGADWGIGGGWLSTTLIGAASLWSGGATLLAWGLAGVPPALGTLLAWLFRRALFEGDDDRTRRSRGSLGVSRLHARLIRDLERAGLTVPLAANADDLATIAAAFSPDAAATLRAWAELYQAARFGDAQPSDDVLQTWKPKLKAAVRGIRTAVREAERRDAASPST